MANKRETSPPVLFGREMARCGGRVATMWTLCAPPLAFSLRQERKDSWFARVTLGSETVLWRQLRTRTGALNAMTNCVWTLSRKLLRLLGEES